MSALVVCEILTALAVLVVALTQLRLARGRERGAGRWDIPTGLVNTHTLVGVLAILVWGWFLVAEAGRGVGIGGLVLFWATTGLGLAILARWLPAHGRHAAPQATDSWTKGPWLSMLAHLGMLGGTIAFTALFVGGSL